MKLSSQTNVESSVKLLLGKFSISRENVDVKDVNKRTPLHWAAAHGCYDQVGFTWNQINENQSHYNGVCTL